MILTITNTVVSDKNPIESESFGRGFTPHMFKMSLNVNQSSDYEAEIIPLEAEPFSPASQVFHYSQSVFEGMKAFKTEDGELSIFRADQYAKRFRNSASRIALLDFKEELFMAAITEFVKFEKNYIKLQSHQALYLRPILFAVDENISLSPSENFKFYIVSTIVGGYFGGKSDQGLKILIRPGFSRACSGGTGNTKTSGNYGGTLFHQKYAASKGCNQTLYLNPSNNETIDELGGMNFFIIEEDAEGKKLITPPLSDRILPGVTRKSILELADSCGLNAIERNITLTELISKTKEGKITEAFACGTAAVITPIHEFLIDGEEQIELKVSGSSEKTKQLKELLENIQRGKIPAPGQWLFKV